MKATNRLTKGVALVGTLLVWVPILAPILLSLILSIQKQIVRFDYLMPAELFVAAVVGGGLLLWAAFRARAYGRLIGWSLATAIGLLVSGQALAVVTGLASGATEPTGWAWTLVLATLVIYVLALLTMGIGGVLLLRRLYRPPQSPANTLGHAPTL